MRTVAIVNQKGGCGKTTVAINLASALAGAQKKVLLVDMDSQSHCAVGLAVPEEQIEQSIYDVLISRSKNEPLRLTEVLWQISDRLELAPASIDLSAFEQQMAGVPDRESCLRTVLQDVADDYDFAVVDCPPAVGLLTFNALRAATDVVVPVETGYFALHGLSKQLETLSILCKRCDQKVNVRVLASMYDIRTKMAREILAELRSHFGDRMFKTIVNFNTKLKEAASFGQPISEYDAASKGQQDFQSLAQEVIGAQAQQQSRQLVNSLADQLGSISATATELLRTPAQPAAKPFPMQAVEAAPQGKPFVSPAVDPLESIGAAAREPQRAPAQTPAKPFAVRPVEARPQGKAAVGSVPDPLESIGAAAHEPVRTSAQPAAKPPAVHTPAQAASVVTPPAAVPSGAAAPAATAPAAKAPSAGTPAAAVEPRGTTSRVPPVEVRAVPSERAKEPVAAAAPAFDARATDARLSEYYGVSQIRDAVVFITLYPRAQRVQIAGDFNNWQPLATPMQRVGESGIWQAKVKLPQGRHRYRLVVDGQWQQDPYNEKTEVNPYGEYNSIVEVK